MPPTPAYLITWTTYGTWLQGDDRGSVLGRSNASVPYARPDRGLKLSGERRLKSDPLIFNCEQRSSVENTIRDHCEHRGWVLHALAVRTNHVHVVAAGDSTPERILTQLKAWTTRRLREAGLVRADTRVWTKHGSTRYLSTRASLEGAVRYVRDGQGSPLDHT